MICTSSSLILIAPRDQGRESKFVLLHRIVGPAVADAEIDPAAAKPIDSANHVGDQNGISQRRKKDRRAQTNAPRTRADGGEGRERIEARPGDTLSPTQTE